MSDECPVCQAAYHNGREHNGNTIKLSRQRHLAHVAKRIEQARKAKKTNALLERHYDRLVIDWPCGAVRFIMGPAR